ncbi:PREDICTED: protein LURP-one-related 15-like [Nicotiana attenuata]|uniref:Protein lurp-one-related 15 n=1 Tax=Nicotiana attenuata TaxID=49451 RepID=A0A1J6JPF7_NICAT|nr:PREDICTED: protein LURP-one-related 15-like [Nicotiana attenuata]OIT19666.1 protein lurp-one-related 15 [Nicotiana attenuata]
MAGTSDPQMAVPANPVAVIGSQLCVPYPSDLNIVKKVMTLKDGAFQVVDANGNALFKVKGQVFSLRERRVLVDGSGNPLVTFQQKLLSAHNRWQAFRGESTNAKDLLFSVKKSALLQLKTKLDVYLAANTKEEVCDFKIEGSWLDKSCAIYAANSTKIAQMHKKLTAESMLLGKDNFGVSVSENIDHAFIVALIVILDEINEND